MRLTDNIMGAALMTGCVLAYVVNDALMKLLFAEIALFQAVFLRGLMTIPLLCLMVWRSKVATCGLSRQKQGYARSLCELVASGELDLADLPRDDEEAIAELTRIKGIGRWSAEIYLLFAEGRGDIWPAGDLAVQEAVGRMLELAERPSEKETRTIGEAWRPHRGAMAIFTWHAYTNAAL